jgi:hypothetical protein
MCIKIGSVKNKLCFYRTKTQDILQKQKNMFIAGFYENNKQGKFLYDIVVADFLNFFPLNFYYIKDNKINFLIQILFSL